MLVHWVVRASEPRTLYFEMRSDMWKFDLVNSSLPFTCVTFQIHLKAVESIFTTHLFCERLSPCASMCLHNKSCSVDSLESKAIHSIRYFKYSFFSSMNSIDERGECCNSVLKISGTFSFRPSCLFCFLYICHQSPWITMFFLGRIVMFGVRCSIVVLVSHDVHS